MATEQATGALPEIERRHRQEATDHACAAAEITAALVRVEKQAASLRSRLADHERAVTMATAAADRAHAAQVSA